MAERDLKSRVIERFGSEIKQPAIFILNPVVKSPSHLRRLLRAYLDERRKRTVTRPDQVAISQDAPEYVDAIMRKEAPLRPGIDYVQSEAGLHYFGSVKRTVCSAGEPGSLSEEEEVDAVIKWWCQQTQDHAKQAYHMEYSLHPLLSLELGKRGIPIDPVLVAMAAKTLFEYNSRYHPEGVIGFVIGVHHDKPTAHAHVLLFPRLSTGKGLNVSNNQKVQVDGKDVTIHYHDMLQGSFYRQADRLRREMEFSGPKEYSTKMQQEVLVALAALQNADRRAGKNAPLPSIMEEREALLDDRNLGARLAATQTAEKELYKPTPVTADEVQRSAASFRRLAEEARAGAAASRRDIESVAAAFTKHRDARAYRPVYYAPQRAETPSGTRSFLHRKRVEKATDVFELPSDEGFDLRETSDRAAAFMHDQETSIAELRDANRILREGHQRTMSGINERFVRAMLNSLSALQIAGRVKGELPAFLAPTDFSQLRVHSAAALRNDLAHEVKEGIKKEAFDHRPYRAEEFQDVPRRAWLNNLQPFQQSTPPTTAPSKSVIPDGPNFLARDLSSSSGEIVRDMASLDEEDRLQRSDFDRLLRTRRALETEFER